MPLAVCPLGNSRARQLYEANSGSNALLRLWFDQDKLLRRDPSQVDGVFMERILELFHDWRQLVGRSSNSLAAQFSDAIFEAGRVHATG